MIEAIARSVPCEPPTDLERQQSAALKTLMAVLDSDKALRKKVRAVSEAQDRLARLESVFISVRIEEAAEKFGLPPNWITGAAAFLRLRNKRLGHPGPSTSQAERAPFFEQHSDSSAFGLARGILDAYVKWLRTSESSK